MKRTISEGVAALAGSGEQAGGPVAVVPQAAGRPLRDLMDDRLLDALLERSRDQAGGLRRAGDCAVLTGRPPTMDR